MHARAFSLIVTAVAVTLATLAGGDPLAGVPWPVVTAEATTAVAAASAVVGLFQSEKQASNAQEARQRSRKKQKEQQEAQKAATVKEERQEIREGSEDAQRLRAARRLRRQGGAQRQLLSGSDGSVSSTSGVGTSSSLAG